ncbi:hypothetical protein FHS18_004780 [Paenibacillus phyllosphaerae]|uniref:Uncharacterized protein n=1 Tax=Paenibacillus phyllosphaerae TaxID=274593 RepID=A0A7W5FQ54_9BACL|nr:hypothetical protein [Paenibacillus phyllosphaerae]
MLAFQWNRSVYQLLLRPFFYYNKETLLNHEWIRRVFCCLLLSARYLRRTNQHAIDGCYASAASSASRTIT